MGIYLRKNKILLAVTFIFSAIVSGGTVYIAIILQDIVNAATKGLAQEFKQMILFTFVYLAVLGIIKYIYHLCSKKMVKNITKDLRRDLCKGILNRDYKDFEQYDTAEYISMLTNDVKIIEENYILPLLKVIENSVIFLVSIILLIKLSPLVLIALIVCFGVMAVVSSFISKVLQTKQEIFSVAIGDYTSKIKDLFGGYSVIKSFNVTKKSFAAFEDENDVVVEKKYQADKTGALNESLSDVLGLLTMFSVVAIGSYMVLQGDVLVGTLIALVQLSNTFVNPIMIITMSIPQLQSIKPIVKKFNNLIFTNSDDSKKVKKTTFEKAIEIKNLSFSYDGSNEVLRDINLSIEKNKKYVIIGQSGCGKSTLTKLILGMNKGYSGEIVWDKEELNRLDTTELTKLYSLIHQNIYLFNKSIRENILLFEDFNEEEVNQALSISGVNEFIKDQKGLDNNVGESGGNLSGGQKQRIAVARGLIRNKPILILDEGTSALDLRTSYLLEDKLLNFNDLTIIAITHKLNSDLLHKYDEVIYMEEGRILEKGSFDELVKNEGAFYRLYSLSEVI
ncbi:ABC transporter ATP-binding protein [Bacillus sp. ICE1]|uniref:ABC transporter ATP-binding protein n=1 Tax=Bacillus TaxID=1386 RepID=UPI001E4AE009|nr:MULTISPECIES: ABC transporter ATP-binding protein [unclassified Bacillus (in: firmicutes)]MCC8301768.1 ABC transporter ATP-binding protein/permease [Bacillus sp. AF12]MDV9080746.1 ABC transporter ATP-binding protein [Bacillus sp. ICE1]